MGNPGQRDPTRTVIRTGETSLPEDWPDRNLVPESGSNAFWEQLARSARSPGPYFTAIDFGPALNDGPAADPYYKRPHL